jgi:hypothetical protein
MPMWRCPHCGTPQAETSRCWVCKRSSTSCGTCRHFRRSVAAQLGYCGLDRHRLPLNGDEIRACWEAAAVEPADDDRPVAPPAFVARRADGRTTPDDPAPAEAGVIPRGFVPVGSAEIRRERRVARQEAAAQAAAAADPEPARSRTADPSLRVGLWGDLDA